MKVYEVYMVQHFTWECADKFLQVCATKEAAERYIKSRIKKSTKYSLLDLTENDFYFKEVEVYE